MHSLLEKTPEQFGRDLKLLEDLKQVHQSISNQKLPYKKMRRKVLSQADLLFQQLSEPRRRIFVRILAKRVREETAGALVLPEESVQRAVAQATLRVGLVPKRETAFMVYLYAAVFAALGTMMQMS